MFEAEKPQMKVIIYCFDSTVGPFRFMGDTFLTFTPIKEALLTTTRLQKPLLQYTKH